jgi:hypothetical protein
MKCIFCDHDTTKDMCWECQALFNTLAKSLDGAKPIQILLTFVKLLRVVGKLND